MKPSLLVSSTTTTMMSLVAAAATLLLLAVIMTPSSMAAYMVPRSGGRIGSSSTTVRLGPNGRPSYGFYSPLSSPPSQFSSVTRPAPSSPRRQTSSTLVAAPVAVGATGKNKSGPERMFDLYCSMVWIVRPDLFLYDRLARMAWDTLGKNLKKMEADNAPENVVNRALRDMQNDLAKLQSAYNDVTDTQRRMAVQIQQAEAAADELYHRAQYALSQGYEQRSRDALYRRQELLEGINKLQADIDAQTETRDKLYEAFQTLEVQFRERIVRRNDLMNRAKTAKRMTKINDMLNEFNTKRLSDGAMDNLERKVETMEAQAEASSWFGLKSKKQDTATPMTEDERLEMEFAKLEDSAAVEKEIEKMKEQTSRSTSPSSRQEKQQEEWLDQLLGARKY